MKRVGAALLGLAALAAAGAARAQAAGQWRGPEAIWAASCSYCHETGVGPELRGIRLPPATIEKAVRSGFVQMPAFHPSEISDAELRSLAAWLSAAPAPARAPTRAAP